MSNRENEFLLLHDEDEILRLKEVIRIDRGPKILRVLFPDGSVGLVPDANGLVEVRVEKYTGVLETELEEDASGDPTVCMVPIKIKNFTGNLVP